MKKIKPLIFRMVRKGLAITTGLFIIICIFFDKCDITIGPAISPEQVRQNVLNSEKVRIGMKEEVLQIMGSPQRIDSYGLNDPKWWNQQGVKSYHYQPPDLASDGIDIRMDTTGAVVHITYSGI
jgi:hypothetical protein